ncbi:hypothetical protein Avbf_06420 [Armadillidium vulgare]|nr:hypothetical protein Avbf_06420 [Armadillidium vulgare]
MNRTPLWRCEALEFYFSNDKDEYILAMYGPYGEKNTYFFEGERNYVRNVIPSIYEARINGSLWTGICFIPFKHLPYNVIIYLLSNLLDNLIRI